MGEVADIKKLATDIRDLCDWYKAHRPQQKVVHVKASDYRLLQRWPKELHGSSFRRGPGSSIYYSDFLVEAASE